VPAEHDETHTRTRVSSSSVDRVLVEIAERQHRVVTGRQLRAHGIGPRAVEHLRARGRLHRAHRGVYAIGAPGLGVEERRMAAVLAGGPGAVGSHRMAAAAWEVRASALLELTTPSQRRGHPGVIVHEAGLAADEVTTHRGIPVTTVARTLLDLAAVVDPRELRAAVNEAEYRRLLGGPVCLAELVSRHPGRRGVAALRATVADLDLGRSVSPGRLAAAFHAFREAHGLPRPDEEVPFEIHGHGIRADCVWVARRLVVELDGRQAHGTRSRFEGDRVRDRALQAMGWRVVRVTWRQLHVAAERRALATDLHLFLAGPPNTTKPTPHS
jgi:hypothetical protein